MDIGKGIERIKKRKKKVRRQTFTFSHPSLQPKKLAMGMDYLFAKP